MPKGRGSRRLRPGSKPRPPRTIFGERPLVGYSLPRKVPAWERGDSVLKEQLKVTTKLIEGMLAGHSRFSKGIAVGRRDAISHNLHPRLSGRQGTALSTTTHIQREPGVERLRSSPCGKRAKRGCRPVQRCGWPPLRQPSDVCMHPVFLGERISSTFVCLLTASNSFPGQSEAEYPEHCQHDGEGKKPPLSHRGDLRRGDNERQVIRYQGGAAE